MIIGFVIPWCVGNFTKGRIEPSQVVVKLGCSFYANCYSITPPMWLKDNNLVSFNLVTNYVLYIKKVTLKYSGKYVCRGIDYTGEIFEDSIILIAASMTIISCM